MSNIGKVTAGSAYIVINAMDATGTTFAKIRDNFRNLVKNMKLDVAKVVNDAQLANSKAALNMAKAKEIQLKTRLKEEQYYKSRAKSVLKSGNTAELRQLDKMTNYEKKKGDLLKREAGYKKELERATKQGKEQTYIERIQAQLKDVQKEYKRTERAQVRFAEKVNAWKEKKEETGLVNNILKKAEQTSTKTALSANIAASARGQEAINKGVEKAHALARQTGIDPVYRYGGKHDTYHAERSAFPGYYKAVDARNKEIEKEQQALKKATQKANANEFLQRHDIFLNAKSKQSANFERQRALLTEQIRNPQLYLERKNLAGTTTAKAVEEKARKEYSQLIFNEKVRQQRAQLFEKQLQSNTKGFLSDMKAVAKSSNYGQRAINTKMERYSNALTNPQAFRDYAKQLSEKALDGSVSKRVWGQLSKMNDSDLQKLSTSRLGAINERLFQNRANAPVSLKQLANETRKAQKPVNGLMNTIPRVYGEMQKLGTQSVSICRNMGRAWNDLTVRSIGGFAKTLSEAGASVLGRTREIVWNVYRVGDAIGNVGQTLSMIGGGAMMVAAQPVSQYARFEYAMLSAKAKMQATEEEYQRLIQLAKRLGVETIYTAENVANTTVVLAQAGLKSTQIENSLEGITDAAAATGTDLPVMADYVTMAIRGFEMDFSEATKVADIFTAACNNSALGAMDIGEALKMASANAHMAGASLEDTMAAIALLGNVGIRGTLAGTALRRMFANLSDKDKMAKFGIVTTDEAGNLRPFLEIMEEVNQLMAGRGNAENIQDIKDMFGIWASAGASNLTTKIEELKEFSDIMKNSAGIAKKTASEILAGMLGNFERIRSAFESLSNTIGQSFKTAIESAKDILVNLFKKMETWAGMNGELFVEIVAIAGALVAFGLTLTGVASVLKVTTFTLNTLLGVSAIVRIGVIALSVAYGILQGSVSAFMAIMSGVWAVLSALGGSVLVVVTLAQWAYSASVTASTVAESMATAATMARRMALIACNAAMMAATAAAVAMIPVIVWLGLVFLRLIGHVLKLPTYLNQLKNTFMDCFGWFTGAIGVIGTEFMKVWDSIRDTGIKAFHAIGIYVRNGDWQSAFDTSCIAIKTIWLDVKEFLLNTMAQVLPSFLEGIWKGYTFMRDCCISLMLKYVVPLSQALQNMQNPYVIAGAVTAMVAGAALSVFTGGTSLIAGASIAGGLVMGTAATLGSYGVGYEDQSVDFEKWATSQDKWFYALKKGITDGIVEGLDQNAIDRENAHAEFDENTYETERQKEKNRNEALVGTRFTTGNELVKARQAYMDYIGENPITEEQEQAIQNIQRNESIVEAGKQSLKTLKEERNEVRAQIKSLEKNIRHNEKQNRDFEFLNQANIKRDGEKVDYTDWTDADWDEADKRFSSKGVANIKNNRQFVEAQEKRTLETEQMNKQLVQDKKSLARLNASIQSHENAIAQSQKRIKVNKKFLDENPEFFDVYSNHENAKKLYNKAMKEGMPDKTVNQSMIDAGKSYSKQWFELERQRQQLLIDNATRSDAQIEEGVDNTDEINNLQKQKELVKQQQELFLNGTSREIQNAVKEYEWDTAQEIEHDNAMKYIYASENAALARMKIDYLEKNNGDQEEIERLKKQETKEKQIEKELELLISYETMEDYTENVWGDVVKETEESFEEWKKKQKVEAKVETEIKKQDDAINRVYSQKAIQAQTLDSIRAVNENFDNVRQAKIEEEQRKLQEDQNSMTQQIAENVGGMNDNIQKITEKYIEEEDKEVP